MAAVVLKIDAHLCGPVSVGTVSHVKVIRKHLGLGLAEAKAIVDRAVFDGEEVKCDVPDLATGEALAKDLREIEGPAPTEARVID